MKRNNGGSTNYYDIPNTAKTLDDLIEYKNMPFWLGCIFKACYRLGNKKDTSITYDLNKIIYYANRGLKLQNKD